MELISYSSNRTNIITLKKNLTFRPLSGQQAMNRDEGSYQLSHAYDRFLDTASSRRVKNRKNWVPASSDEGLCDRGRNVKFF